MKKIKDFFVNLCKLIKETHRHQKFHILIGSIFPLLLWSIGFSFIMAILCGSIAGLIEEVIYCYAPLKIVKIWKLRLKIPDINSWKYEVMTASVKTRHDFENENYKYNFIGLTIFILIIILIKLL